MLREGALLGGQRLGRLLLLVLVALDELRVNLRLNLRRRLPRLLRRLLCRLLRARRRRRRLLFRRGTSLGLLLRRGAVRGGFARGAAASQRGSRARLSRQRRRRRLLSLQERPQAPGALSVGGMHEPSLVGERGGEHVAILADVEAFVHGALEDRVGGQSLDARALEEDEAGVLEGAGAEPGGEILHVDVLGVVGGVGVVCGRVRGRGGAGIAVGVLHLQLFRVRLVGGSRNVAGGRRRELALGRGRRRGILRHGLGRLGDDRGLGHAPRRS